MARARVSVLVLGALACACAEGGAGSDGSSQSKSDTSPGLVDTTPSGDGSIFDAIDDAPCLPGSSIPCTTSCGTPGDAACISGEYGSCKPKPGDLCAGLDCKGKGDGLEHLFFRDADGDGHGEKTSTKASCQPPPDGWVTTSDDCDDARGDVHPGAKEVCDKVDNDCNGSTDEGVHILVSTQPYSSLPPCDITDHASCKRGAYDWCRAKSSCYDGGFGPVELGPSEGTFVCVSGGTLTGGWSDVTAAQPACSSDSMASERVCESAVNRAGRGKGYAGAVLQTHAPGVWQFLGLPAERAVEYDSVPWTELTAKHGGCKLGAESSWDCNAATHRWCTAKGHVSGFGPVEYNSTYTSVVCVKS